MQLLLLETMNFVNVNWKIYYYRDWQLATPAFIQFDQVIIC